MSASTGTKKTHDFKSHLVWDGNLGDGTSTYKGYGRKYRVQIEGKPDLPGSADPVFRGDSDRYNPEDLFVASISTCHLLTYLSLCPRHKISVVAYEDNASGTLVLTPDGGGKFESVTLRPKVTIAPGGDEKRAMELHETAHRLCFIAASVSVPVHHEPQIIVAQATTSAHKSTEIESRP